METQRTRKPIGQNARMPINHSAHADQLVYPFTASLAQR